MCIRDRVYVLDGFVAYVEEGGRADPALAHRVVDGQGAYLTPGFVDPHVHIESAMLTPRAFAAAVVPHGTTTVVTDPHEIANVLGAVSYTHLHNEGKGAKYTRGRRPVCEIYRECCADRSAALRREAAVKRLSRQQKLQLAASSGQGRGGA